MEGTLTQKGTDLAMGHGIMVRSKSYVTNAVITNTETADLIARDLGGLLSEPIVLDTSLMGDVVVTLHVTGDSIVSTCSANRTTPLIFSANAGFNLGRLTLNNIYASIKVMAKCDPAYSTLAKRLIQEKGFVEVPFNNIHSSTGSHLGTSWFNVATQSHDRVWVCFRNNANLGDHKPVVAARGYRNSANVSEFPEHTMLERWIPSEFVLSVPDKNATFQLTLNGTQYPQFPSSADGWLAITPLYHQSRQPRLPSKMISELASRLANFTTTTVRLDPKSGQQTVGPGQMLEFDLPSECVVNLDSFTLSFIAAPLRLNGSLGHVRLPNGIEHLIEDVSVWCNGLRLDSAGRWFNRRHTLMDFNQERCGDAFSHPRVQRRRDTRDVVSMMEIVQLPNRYSTSRLGEGFLGAGTIDTSLMPQLTVQITFTHQPVVTASANDGSAGEFTNLAGLLNQDFSYNVRDAYAMVEVVSLGPVYDQLQQRLMASKGYIAYPYKRYMCFDGGVGEGNVRFQVSSQSVDRIYAFSVDYTPTRGVVAAETSGGVTDADIRTVAEMYCTRALRSRVRTGDGLGNTNSGESP
jgi:hypothetical protein